MLSVNPTLQCLLVWRGVITSSYFIFIFPTHATMQRGCIAHAIDQACTRARLAKLRMCEVKLVNSKMASVCIKLLLGKKTLEDHCQYIKRLRYYYLRSVWEVASFSKAARACPRYPYTESLATDSLIDKLS